MIEQYREILGKALHSVLHKVRHACLRGCGTPSIRFLHILHLSKNSDRRTTTQTTGLKYCYLGSTHAPLPLVNHSLQQIGSRQLRMVRPAAAQQRPLIMPSCRCDFCLGLGPSRQRRRADLLVLEAPFEVSKNQSQTHRIPRKARMRTWEPPAALDSDEDYMDEDLAEAVLDQVNLGQDSQQSKVSKVDSNELADGMLSEDLHTVSKSPLLVGPSNSTATSLQAEDHGCFDLGVLVREALHRYKLEKDEKVLLMKCAEWVAISRQPSVISLPTTENIDTASLPDEFVLL